MGRKKTLGLFLVGFSLFGLLIFLVYLLYFTRFLVLKEVRILGNQKVSREELMKLLELRGGEIFYRINLSKLRDKIKQHHLIEEVIIRRHLPSTLEVKVIERSPLAILLKNNRGYLIDRKGVTLADVSPNDLLYYPLVSIDAERNKEVLLNFLSWLKENKKYLPVYENLQKIVLTNDKIIMTTKGKILIYLPIVNTNELYNLYAYLDRIMIYIYDNKLGDKVELIRLDYPFGQALIKNRT